jgi:ssDNA-binding Zn-finger/Zn-ribbon topoisomerase 1
MLDTAKPMPRNTALACSDCGTAVGMGSLEWGTVVHCAACARRTGRAEPLSLGSVLAHPCPECGDEMTLRKSSFGLFYGCARYPRCKATHSAHPDGRPLGIPGDAKTKAARQRAHKAFDTLWHGAQAPMSRTEAYLWLQDVTGLPKGEAHIGRFSVRQCDRLIRLVEKNDAH